MKFLTRAMAMVLATSLLLGTVSVSAEPPFGFTEWAKSLFPSLPKAAIPAIKPVVKAAGASGWFSWVDKCTIRFNPVEGCAWLGKKAWENPGWTTTSLAMSWVIKLKYFAWWDLQIDLRDQICGYLKKDIKNLSKSTGKNRKKRVDELAQKCRTLLGLKDSALTSLITEYYTMKGDEQDVIKEKLETIENHCKSKLKISILS